MDDQTRIAPAEPQRHGLVYDGKGRQMFGLVLRNTLFTVLTLGIYRFWAKTRLRAFIWSRLNLLGDRLEYTGKAMELLLGFLIVLGIFIPGSVGLHLASLALTKYGAVGVQVVLEIAVYLGLTWLIGYAVFRARRYRLSRTLWRGIRFGQADSPARFAWLFLRTTLLQGITLGIYTPYAQMRQQSFLMNNTRLGNRAFAFEGEGSDLLGRWVLCLVLAPFTLGLSLLWYAAMKSRYIARMTRFGAVRFELPVTFGDFARIYIPYFLLIGIGYFAVATAVGLAQAGMGAKLAGIGATPAILVAVGVILLVVLFPAIQALLVTHRFLGLMTKKLSMIGAVDADAIVQAAGPLSRTGEGLADMLDVGDFDVGL